MVVLEDTDIEDGYHDNQGKNVYVKKSILYKYTVLEKSKVQ